MPEWKVPFASFAQCIQVSFYILLYFNNVCHFCSFNSEKYYLCENQSLDQLNTIIAIDSTSSNETQSTLSRIFDEYKPYVPANPLLISNSNWAYCPFPDLNCEEFSFSCENGVEIMMDEICFKRKYPALDLVNFNNSASPFNDSCIWSQDTDDFRMYKLDLLIDDKDCREQAIYRKRF